MSVCKACRHAGCVLADVPTACVPCHRRYTPDGGGKPYIVAVKRLKLELFRSAPASSPQRTQPHSAAGLLHGRGVRLVGPCFCLRDREQKLSPTAMHCMCRNQEDLDLFLKEIELMRKLRHR